MTEHDNDRWFILPMMEHERLGTTPEYTFRTEGILGISGKMVSREDISNFGSTTKRRPDVEDWWVGRVFGTEEALDKLDKDHKDVRELGDNPQAVDNILSNVMPSIDTSNWDEHFNVVDGKNDG